MTPGRLAFGLLLLGEVIQWALIPIGGALYPGYDHLRQYISELGATGAVTGSTVSWWGFFPAGILIIGFCLIAAWLLRRNALAVVGMLLMAWYACGLIGAAFYPCAFECARDGTDPAQMMHDLIGGTGYLAGVMGVLLAGLAAARTRAKGLVPLGVICASVASLGFSGLLADIELIGLSQRVLEAALTVFLLSFGWALAKGRLEPAGA